MLTKFQIYIILAPFLATLILSFLFLFFQIFSNKKYLFNLFVSFILIFLLVIFFVYKFNQNLNDQQIFYLIFSFLCNSYIFMNIVQVPISSIQLTILRIVYLNPKITKRQIIQKYNASQIFEERLARLKAGDIIYKNKSHFFFKK